MKEGDLNKIMKVEKEENFEFEKDEIIQDEIEISFD